MKLPVIIGKALIIKGKQIIKNRRKLTLAYVSLFLTVLLALGSTFAWFASRDKINVLTQPFQMIGPDSIQNSQLQTNQTKVVIPDFKLEEASSVDGRNIFFPASITDNVSDSSNASMSTQTSEMVFREGNAGDKNKLYAYESVDINSSGATTYVWIKGYKVKVGDNVYHDQMDLEYENNIPVWQDFPDSCPVRIAIIDDSGHTPKIFDPSAKVRSDNYVTNTDAIYSVTVEGEPTTRRTNLDSFSSYYYGTGNPLFVVDAGKSVNLTVVAWLEGTHPHAADYCGEEMRVELEIETNVSEMEYVYLHDWTVADNDDGVNSSTYIDAQNWGGSHWLGGELIAMSYYDTSAKTYKTTIMTLDGTDASYGGNVYKAAIPKYVTTDISFYRLNNSYTNVPYGLIFNSWHTRSGVNNQLYQNIKNSKWKVLGDLQDSRKIGSTVYSHYFAIRGNGYGVVPHERTKENFKKWLSPCIGYWGTSAGPIGSSAVTPTTAPTQSGGGSTPTPSSSITISELKLDIPDAGTFSGNWYRNDISASGNYDMMARFSNDGGSTYWEVAMTRASDNSSVSLKNYTDSRFTSSTQLIGFAPKNRNDGTYKKVVKINYWTIQSNYNKTFALTSDSWASG